MTESAEPAAAPEAVGASESPPDPEAVKKAAESLAWLDEALRELGGALTACGECIDAGTLPAEAVSSRMNALVMQMMAGGAG